MVAALSVCRKGTVEMPNARMTGYSSVGVAFDSVPVFFLIRRGFFFFINGYVVALCGPDSVVWAASGANPKKAPG